jgi:hypothetical protein
LAVVVEKEKRYYQNGEVKMYCRQTDVSHVIVPLKIYGYTGIQRPDGNVQTKYETDC